MSLSNNKRPAGGIKPRFFAKIWSIFNFEECNFCRGFIAQPVERPKGLVQLYWRGFELRDIFLSYHAAA